MEVFGVVGIDNITQNVALDMEDAVKTCIDVAHKTPTFRVGNDRPSAMLITTATEFMSYGNIDRLIRVGGICQTLVDEHMGFLVDCESVMIPPHVISNGTDMEESMVKDAIEEIEYFYYEKKYESVIVKLNSIEREWLFIKP